MTAPSTDDLIARLRHAANGSGGAGGPRCLQTAAADRLETLRKAAEGMAEALNLGRELTEQDELQGCAGWDAFHSACLDASAAYHAIKEKQP